ncbi:MAG: phosphoribosyltransferase [Candidatus Hodarchaeota archaeon]
MSIQDKKKKLDLVIGVFRGGVVLARSLASKLGDLPVFIIKLSKPGYEEIACFGDDEKIELENSRDKNLNALLVDDISDSGDTFKLLIKNLQKFGFKNLYTASLVLKEYSGYKPDFHVVLDNSKDWLIFPWE